MGRDGASAEGRKKEEEEEEETKRGTVLLFK